MTRVAYSLGIAEQTIVIQYPVSLLEYWSYIVTIVCLVFFAHATLSKQPREVVLGMLFAALCSALNTSLMADRKFDVQP